MSTQKKVTEAMVIDNSQVAINQLKIAKQKALTEIGMKWLENVTPLVPVDTGRLKASMSYVINPNSGYIIMGTNVEYAITVEIGNTRRRPKPYMRPSVFNHLDTYKLIIKRNLSK